MSGDGVEVDLLGRGDQSEPGASETSGSEAAPLV